jgi:hypothetical protein
MQSYETTEHKIRREFEAYGPIKRVGTSEWFLKQLTAITIGEMYMSGCFMMFLSVETLQVVVSI